MDGECWPWTGDLSPDGYGRAGHEFAHRLAYQEARGAIPAGVEIDHLCRNRACVNPDHMEVVAHSENVRRSVAFWPSTTKTHCKSGHPFTPDNTYLRPGVAKGRRQCRACNADAQRRYKSRRSA